MKIAYDENPLKIQVFLDDKEKDFLRSKNLDSFQKTREQAAKWLVNYRNEHFGVEHE
jgi:hypothetical protein